MKLACPECATPLKVADDLAADARLKCPRCGTRFSPGGCAPPESEALELDDCETEPGGRRSRVVPVAVIGGLLLLGVAGAVGWFATRPPKENDPPAAAAPAADPKPVAKKEPDSPPAPKPPKPSGDGQRLTAVDLLTCYQTNPAAAGSQYNGAVVTVTGTLFYSPTQYPSGEVVVRLAGTRPDGPSVWCRMAPGPDGVASRFPSGAVTTIRGRCIGAGAARGPADYPNAGADEVVLADCVVVSEPTIPTPAGTDHPKAITHAGIEVRVTAVQVGHPVLVLGRGGPNAGVTAQSREKYLIFRLQVSNKRPVDFMTVHTYEHPSGATISLRDEKGNHFGWCRTDAAPTPGSVMAQELAADPKRRWRFRDESTKLLLNPGQSETYLLVFASEHLGKGTRLFLSLPDGLFGLRGEPEQIIRFQQRAVEALPADVPTPPAPPAETRPPPKSVNPGEDKPNPAADPVLDANVAALVAQLNKGKMPADRMKAADELLKLGVKAKAATAPLCQALFDPSPQVRVTALDALKAVNPSVYGPVATLVAPLTDADFLFMGSTGRPEAVSDLAKLGAEGRAAVPILTYYKRAICRPGGWPHVAAVVDTLAALAPDDPAVAAVLVQGLLKDGYAQARVAAAKGLAGTKATKESVAALATAVRGDTEPEVRLAAVNTLAKMGADAKAVAKVLEAAKTDPDARVREAARDAIEKVK